MVKNLYFIKIQKLLFNTITSYVEWLGKLETLLEEIHDAPRKRRLRQFKRCTKVMENKGFSPEFIGVAMAPYFIEGTNCTASYPARVRAKEYNVINK